MPRAQSAKPAGFRVATRSVNSAGPSRGSDGRRETPSPEMVSGSGFRRKGFSRRSAQHCWCLIVLGLLAASAPRSEGRVLFLRVPPGSLRPFSPRGPGEVLKNVGYSYSSRDEALGYSYTFTPSATEPDARQREATASVWRRLEPYGLRFWYRESPRAARSLACWGHDVYDPRCDFQEKHRFNSTPRADSESLTVLPSFVESTGTSASAPNWCCPFSGSRPG
mgnify:CR=1 FL=1